MGAQNWRKWATLSLHFSKLELASQYLLLWQTFMVEVMHTDNLKYNLSDQDKLLTHNNA